jgi:hypothetical protein
VSPFGEVISRELYQFHDEHLGATQAEPSTPGEASTRELQEDFSFMAHCHPSNSVAEQTSPIYDSLLRVASEVQPCVPDPLIAAFRDDSFAALHAEARPSGRVQLAHDNLHRTRIPQGIHTRHCESSTASISIIDQQPMCACGGFFLMGDPCNRPADPRTGFCAMCSPEHCMCSCADCDPSSSSSEEDDRTDTVSNSQGSTATDSRPMPALPVPAAQRFLHLDLDDEEAIAAVGLRDNGGRITETFLEKRRLARAMHHTGDIR